MQKGKSQTPLGLHFFHQLSQLNEEQKQKQKQKTLHGLEAWLKW
jgi:hypothetical protein